MSKVSFSLAGVEFPEEANSLWNLDYKWLFEEALFLRLTKTRTRLIAVYLVFPLVLLRSSITCLRI